MKMKDNVAYAALPRELKGRRNVVNGELQKNNGRFRSGKTRKAEVDPTTPVYDYADSEVPRIYRQVEIEYSKFGVEDFDFGITHFVTHTASNSINIIDYGRDGVEVDYVTKIAAFHRFLIELLSSEGNNFPNNPALLKKQVIPTTPRALSSPITQLLGMDAKNIVTCASCGAVREKDNMTHIVDLSYPRKLMQLSVPEAEKRNDLQSPWFVFNDFVVRNISEEEALSFPGRWKIPAIIYFERSDLRDIVDYSGLPNKIEETILNRDPHFIKHEVLQPTELPCPGTFVAIDAEFVSMQQEETEFRSDGTKKVLRPARLSLARVSVLRGGGVKQGIPFIDDHIHTSEVIVDYLTEFSGIKFGDLDPHLTRHTLTPLKLVYKKLRLLVDRGCVFIGHGLSKDFRIISEFSPFSIIRSFVKTGH
ncbi:hypothetical protein H0H87_000111 [Tephrocybe sp. NHM501043]|nr:hypothetical protein H0H87_000111 [Tephrocybe sp. NHM501043]